MGSPTQRLQLLLMLLIDILLLPLFPRNTEACKSSKNDQPLPVEVHIQSVKNITKQKSTKNPFYIDIVEDTLEIKFKISPSSIYLVYK